MIKPRLPSKRTLESPILMRRFLLTINRERQYLQAELSKVQGLMPLLMKPRNKMQWTPEDKAELMVHLRRLANLSPYLAAVVLPGGFAMLPVLAWWLDRRRGRREQPA